jgi:voltage-gated potassium channel Kch
MSPAPDTKKPFTKRQRIRYRFDDTLSRGSTSLILWLGAITFALITVAATLAAALGIPDPQTGEDLRFGEAFWLGLLRALDPGTMGSDVGWPFRLISLFVTLGGVFIAGSLIAVLASAINRRVEVLQGGRSIVAEHGHTLILGWSSKIFTIVSELVVANENQPGAAIVILSMEGKAFMEQQIARRVTNTRGTRIVCRTGIPQDFSDLRVVNVGMAKSVIVLSSPDGDGDAGVVKAALAVVKGPWELDDSVPVVAELVTGDNAQALRGATEGRVTVVQSSRLIARLTAQVCRQPGLSQVYTELLDFAGDEIYFHDEPRLAGSRFADALLAFENSTVMGVKSVDGRVALNPPLDRTVARGETLVVIAPDDNAATFSAPAALDLPRSRKKAAARKPENILLIGWNPLAPLVLKELDTYVADGSSLTALVDVTLVPPEELDLSVGLDSFRVEFVHGPIPGEELEALMARGFDHAIVLCYRQGLTEAEADARVLLTLLQIRAAIRNAGHATNIVAELLDERDVALAQSAGVDEFIVSERLTSLVMAQLSENAGLQPVFEDLLDPEGAEVYLKPVRLYATDGGPRDFASLIRVAAARGEVAIGYKSDGGVRLNPPKSSSLDPSGGDLLVVLAEDEA